MNISFAWTTEAYEAGRKNVTRRDWSNEYMRHFPVGSVHRAWAKSPRAGGKPCVKFPYLRIASIRREPLSRLLDDKEYGKAEIEREGGLWPGGVDEFVNLFTDREMRFGDPVRIQFEPLTVLPADKESNSPTGGEGVKG